METGGFEIRPGGIAVASFTLKAAGDQVGGPGSFRRGLAGYPPERLKCASTPAATQRRHGGRKV
jgi:hypothetical protein